MYVYAHVWVHMNMYVYEYVHVSGEGSCAHTGDGTEGRENLECPDLSFSV